VSVFCPTITNPYQSLYYGSDAILYFFRFLWHVWRAGRYLVTKPRSIPFHHYHIFSAVLSVRFCIRILPFGTKKPEPLKRRENPRQCSPVTSFQHQVIKCERFDFVINIQFISRVQSWKEFSTVNLNEIILYITITLYLQSGKIHLPEANNCSLIH
jgi:hypothetical protein